MSRTYERRPPILGPVILIGIGILALFQNFDILPGNFWQTIWRLWPLILVLIGVEVIIGQMRMPWGLSFLLALVVIAGTVGGVVYFASQTSEETAVSAGDMRRIERDLQGATSATVQLSFGAGTLHLGSVSGGQVMVGDFAQARAHVDYSVSNGRATLRVDIPDDQMVPFFTTGRSNEWRVQLNNGIPIDLRVEAGASTNDLDLTDLKLSQLQVKAGVSANTIRLARTGKYEARISGGISTTTVEVPEGLAARIKVEGGLSTVNINESRFPRSGDLYESTNYDSASDKVDLVIESGLSTITVK